MLLSLVDSCLFLFSFLKLLFFICRFFGFENIVILFVKIDCVKFGFFNEKEFCLLYVKLLVFVDWFWLVWYTGVLVLWVCLFVKFCCIFLEFVIEFFFFFSLFEENLMCKLLDVFVYCLRGRIFIGLLLTFVGVIIFFLRFLRFLVFFFFAGYIFLFFFCFFGRFIFFIGYNILFFFW